MVLGATAAGGCLLSWHAVVVLFVHVHLDDSVPTSGYNRTVVITVADERNFAFLWVVLVKHQGVNTRHQVKDFHFACVRADYHLSVVIV